jgi:hypothetical protein
MTENQWPQDGSYGTAPADARSTDPYDPAYPAGTTTSAGMQSGEETGSSKKDAMKTEAGEVGRQASDSARNVAETAKAEAANVATEVKTNAKDLLYQARSDLTNQAGTQQQKVAEGLRSISSQLHSMASAPDEQGVASDLVRQAAERSSSVASWLEARDPGSLLDEVKSFARQRPGTFLLLAAGAGVLAGRLTKGLTSGSPDSGMGGGTGRSTAMAEPMPGGMAVPPPPVQYPAPTTTTAGAAAGVGGQTYPPNPMEGAGTTSGQWADDPLAGDRVGESPLSGSRPTDDPYRDDPFDGGRR